MVFPFDVLNPNFYLQINVAVNVNELIHQLNQRQMMHVSNLSATLPIVQYEIFFRTTIVDQRLYGTCSLITDLHFPMFSNLIHKALKMEYQEFSSVEKSLCIFMPPYRKIRGILFYRCRSVRPSVRLSVCLSAQT